MAVEFTARHPEMVEKLLLFGAYPRGNLKRGQYTIEGHEARLTLLMMSSLASFLLR